MKKSQIKYNDAFVRDEKGYSKLTRCPFCGNRYLLHHNQYFEDLGVNVEVEYKYLCTKCGIVGSWGYGYATISLDDDKEYEPDKPHPTNNVISDDLPW